MTDGDEAEAFDGDYDYIIVGAGTAGCVLANRLTADPATRVLLVEAGGSDRYLWIHVPVGYLFCIGNPRTDWMLRTEAEPGLNGRSIAYPRGKVVGGCSSINGMIYMRGQAADYDGWRQRGNVGWGWDDVLPYFLKSEDHHGPAGPLHRRGGEWKVRRQRLSWDILKAVQAGAAEFGIRPRVDFNDGDNEGSGFFEVNQHRGRRWSAARGFLAPVLGRPNLRLVTESPAERLVVEGGRVAGLRFRRGGRLFEARAAGEVILAAGAIHSPLLLEASGIGDADRLDALGIPVIADRPAVGENLQDHLQIRTVYRVRGTPTLNMLANSWQGRARMALAYGLRRSGPLSMAPSQFGMFTRSDPALATPDLEYHVQPLSTDRLGEPLHPFPAITVSVCNLRPDSVGSVHRTGPGPEGPSEIRLNYLSAESDRQVAVRALRQARRIMTAKALAPFQPEELLPGPARQTDADLLAAAGDIATTIFHPVGTCRMGSDPGAVVDPELRLRGLAGLRIADASIMPKIVSGNTASPVVMIAEKAADLISAARRTR